MPNVQQLCFLRKPLMSPQLHGGNSVFASCKKKGVFLFGWILFGSWGRQPWLIVRSTTQGFSIHSFLALIYWFCECGVSCGNEEGGGRGGGWVALGVVDLRCRHFSLSELWIYALAALLLNQFPDNVVGKMSEVFGSWSPHMRKPEGFWLWPGSILTIIGISRVNQQMEELYLSLFKTNK